MQPGCNIARMSTADHEIKSVYALEKCHVELFGQIKSIFTDLVDSMKNYRLYE